MKKLLIACFLLACTVSLFAAAQSSGGLKELSGWTDAKDEIARLETLIAATKEAGFPADPAWTARIRELLPLVKGHPGNASYPPPEAKPIDGFGDGAVILPESLSPLEAQIRRLEFEITGGLGISEPDPSLFADLKEQLNGLYAQREINRLRNPLDQGNDACPATVVSGIPYYDNGTTTGRVNNYNPITPCNPTNAPDVIYQFTPQFTYQYVISLQGSSYDTYLYVNTGGACPGTTQVGCNDDYGNLQSYLQLQLNANQTYYIIIDGYSTNAGAYTLAIYDICTITCEASDLLECPETLNDSTHAYLDCNGACNNITHGGTATWQDILPFQTVCGRAFTYLGPSGSQSRDTDIYRFTLTEACSLRISLTAEFVSKLFVLTSSCPWSPLYDPPASMYACSTSTYYTQCFQPGDYALWVGPYVFTGIEDFREYRVRMELIPCSGCGIDVGVQAPASVSSTTCGSVNNCSLRPSEDMTIAVAIPWAGDWTFSLCSPNNVWDSYIYLTSSCCSGVIASNDDGCGGVGLSVINCLSLNRGVYYLTVEGYSSTYCGPFTLTVTECFGSCCYGDPVDPICEYTSSTVCADYGGVFTLFEPCSTGACYTRPNCNGQTAFGQLPFLPDEAGNGYWSHIDYGYMQYDNYATDGPIGSIRFWGFPVSCNGYAENFQVQFASGSSTQTYNVSSTGTQLPLTYFGVYPLSEYTATISPPCFLASGIVSVAKVGDPSCTWYWCTSPFGDGVWPGGVQSDFAFCLGSPCFAPDSVTIKWIGTNLFQFDWWMPQTSYVYVYSTLTPEAVFPTGYDLFAWGALSAGHFTWNSVNIPDPNRIFILVNDCTYSSLSGVPTGLTLVKQTE